MFRTYRLPRWLSEDEEACKMRQHTLCSLLCSLVSTLCYVIGSGTAIRRSQLDSLAQRLRGGFGRLNHEMLLVEMLERAGICPPDARRHIHPGRKARVQPGIFASRRT